MGNPCIIIFFSFESFEIQRFHFKEFLGIACQHSLLKGTPKNFLNLVLYKFFILEIKNCRFAPYAVQFTDTVILKVKILNTYHPASSELQDV